MNLLPNLEFPSKEDPQITQTYLYAAYSNGHKNTYRTCIPLYAVLKHKKR